MRPDRRARDRAGQVYVGLRDAIRSRGETRRPFSRCFLSGGAEYLSAGRSEDSEASQATNPVVACLPNRGEGRRTGPQEARCGGAETARVQLRLAVLWHVGMGRTACGPTDHNTRDVGVAAREVALCERTVAAAGARGSRQVGPRLGSATGGVATLLHASKHFGPGGFPRAARRRDNDCVVRLFQVVPPRNLGGGPCLRSGQRD